MPAPAMKPPTGSGRAKKGGGQGPLPRPRKGAAGSGEDTGRRGACPHAAAGGAGQAGAQRPLRRPAGIAAPHRPPGCGPGRRRGSPRSPASQRPDRAVFSFRENPPEPSPARITGVVHLPTSSRCPLPPSRRRHQPAPLPGEDSAAGPPRQRSDGSLPATTAVTKTDMGQKPPRDTICAHPVRNVSFEHSLIPHSEWKEPAIKILLCK